jgi:hypothetical protein
MREFTFTLWLVDDARDIDDWSHAVFEAGGDDTSCGQQRGERYAIFHREAPSLEEAIRSAHQTIQTAGMSVSRLEIEADELAWARS